MTAAWRIFTGPDDLVEGLFGQVVLWTFEVLPELERQGVVAQWDIRSRLYGEAPDYRVLPGVFDSVQAPAQPARRAVSLLKLRNAGVSVLGGDWQAVHQLWHRHFQVPERVARRADEVGLAAGAMGVHYRGTDKNLASIDTNPVSIDDMLLLVEDALASQPGCPALFIATDEFAFVEAARQRLRLPVVNLGEVDFHKARPGHAGKADRALLDCVLLSRCSLVLKCSSALSGFAKVLNPGLPCFRVSASKVFHQVPYFPDAHIPRWQGQGEAARALLARLFEGDWLEAPDVPERFRRPFAWLPRYTAGQVALNRLKYLVSVLRGAPRKA